MIDLSKKKIKRLKDITVEYFYSEMKDRIHIELLTKKVSLKGKITEQNLHRPGLALAGFVELFSYNRIQVVGNTEAKYLNNLSPKKRKASLNKLLKFKIPCIIFTDNNKPSKDVKELAEQHNIPIFISSLSTTKLAYLVSDFLDDQFAPQITMHGSFTDVYGVGMLFTGKSGIGKSEVALDLVERGHRLVADDVVVLTKKGENIIMGSGTELIKHFMEIRGIGIVDIRSMFGIRAIRFQKRLEIIIELEIWDNENEYTRTGLENQTVNVMDVDIQYIKIPILPGKNITVISEVIALNYLLKHYGYNAADILTKNLTEEIKRKQADADRFVSYFEHDFE